MFCCCSKQINLFGFFLSPFVTRSIWRINSLDRLGGVPHPCARCEGGVFFYGHRLEHRGIARINSLNNLAAEPRARFCFVAERLYFHNVLHENFQKRYHPK